jgi:hypothetical protein
MIKLTTTQIIEIADSFEMGDLCFIDTKTNEIKTSIDIAKCAEEIDDDEILKTYKELTSNSDRYIEIPKPDSRQIFSIMESFVNSIDNTNFRDRLYEALNNKKPFQNFKYHIDNSNEYRQKWFNYRKAKIIDWVSEQVDRLDASP